MQAHRAETIMSEDGVLTLHDLPFRRGEPVEIIVLRSARSAKVTKVYPLRGQPVTLQAPFDPVAEVD